MSTTSKLLPFQPLSMTTAELAAVSFLARYSGHTHELYAYPLRRWFMWCRTNGLDALTGIQRAHVELYIRNLGEAGLMASSINTMMHGFRGYFRFAHIDGLIPADPAVYARLPKVQPDDSRTQGRALRRINPELSARRLVPTSLFLGLQRSSPRARSRLYSPEQPGHGFRRGPH